MAETAPPVAAPASKKKPNRLLVEEATNDDNSVVALNTATMEELCVTVSPLPLFVSRPLVAVQHGLVAGGSLTCARAVFVQQPLPR